MESFKDWGVVNVMEEACTKSVASTLNEDTI